MRKAAKLTVEEECKEIIDDAITHNKIVALIKK